MAEKLPVDAVCRPLAVRVHEACRLTGIGRSKLYQLIAARHIEIVKIGTITLIPMASLERLIEVQRQGS